MAATTDDEQVSLDVRLPLGVTTDEEGEHIVRVTVVIPGLQVKKRPDGLKITNKPANFKLMESPKFEDRSFSLDLSLSKDKKAAERYHYAIRKLPHDIIPENCRYKLKKDQVVLLLYKKTARSWAQELANSGLETLFEDE